MIAESCFEIVASIAAIAFVDRDVEVLAPRDRAARRFFDERAHQFLGARRSVCLVAESTLVEQAASCAFPRPARPGDSDWASAMALFLVLLRL
jgi:hypothetical protein